METKYRISSTTGIFLISASLTVDAVQALLDLFIIGGIINRIITPFAWLFFWTWYYLLGIRFAKSPKNQATALISFLIEMIPYVDILPGWTVSAVILINTSRREDAGKKVQPKKKEVGKKEGVSEKKPADKTPKPAEVGAGGPTGVDSGIKPAGESPKQGAAGAELQASQTRGTKPAEPAAGNAPDWKNKSEPPGAQEKDNRGNKENEKEKKLDKPEPGEVDKKAEKDEPADTRTDWYKRQQAENETGLAPDQADYEDIVMNGNQDNIMDPNRDPYREPVDITPKKSAPTTKKTEKTDDQDNDLAEAA